MKKNAVIIGAGVTGLTIAWKLSQAGYDVIVIEKEDTVGGACRTFEHNDFRLDLGPHKLYTQLPDVLKEIQELMGDELLVVPKKSSIYLNNIMLDYPCRITDLAKKLGICFGIKCFISYAFTCLKKLFIRKPILNYTDWVTNRFGAFLYKLMFHPLANKIWGDPATLSKVLAETRISTPSPVKLLFHMIFGYKDNPAINADEFYYPRLGIGRITDRMHEEIMKNGGTVLLTSQVKHITLSDNAHVQSVTVDLNGTVETIITNTVISTLPLPLTCSLLYPTIPHDIQQHAQTLQYRHLLLVYLIIDQESVTHDRWIFFPQKEFIFSRIYEQKMFSPDMCPTNKTVICCDASASSHSPLWKMDDEGLINAAITSLSHAGIIDENTVTETFVKRIKHIYPIYKTGFETHLDPVLSFLENTDVIIPMGRLGLFNYNNIDHCIDMGIKTAEHIIEGKDTAHWHALRESCKKYKIVD